MHKFMVQFSKIQAVVFNSFDVQHDVAQFSPIEPSQRFVIHIDLPGRQRQSIGMVVATAVSDPTCRVSLWGTT